jgi:hypothetical protein
MPRTAVKRIIFVIETPEFAMTHDAVDRGATTLFGRRHWLLSKRTGLRARSDNAVHRDLGFAVGGRPRSLQPVTVSQHIGEGGTS